IVACLKPSNTRCSYMSSDMIQTCGCFTITSAIARSSAAEQQAPDGLLGLFRISHLVFGVMAASMSSERGLKPLFCGHVTNTVSPSNSLVISAYALQDGTGITASSPGFSVAPNALKIACLPPLLTLISSSAKSSPLSRLNFRWIACFSAGVPSCGGYLV